MIFEFVRKHGVSLYRVSALLIATNIACADDVTYYIPETNRHLIKSEFVDQTYQIEVVMPLSQKGVTERLPVLYSTDGNAWPQAFASMNFMLSDEVPRFILVNIGYPSESFIAGSELRIRDLGSPEERKCWAIFEQSSKEQDDVPRQKFEGVIEYHEDDKPTTGTEFLQFIRQELIPFIDSKYPTMVGDNNYFGYSSGGGFGLFTLFTKPDTFRRYIIGSPGTAYEDCAYSLIEAKAFVASGKSIDAKVFMSIGELEGFEQGLAHYRLAEQYYVLARYLLEVEIPGLELTLRIFPEETHATAWAPAYIHGVKALFGPPKCVPWLQSEPCP